MVGGELCSFQVGERRDHMLAEMIELSCQTCLMKMKLNAHDQGI